MGKQLELTEEQLKAFDDRLDEHVDVIQALIDDPGSYADLGGL